MCSLGLLKTIACVLLSELILMYVFGFMFCIFEFWLCMGIIAYYTTEQLLLGLISIILITVFITIVCYNRCSFSFTGEKMKRSNF
jgi:hypothetical protein